MIARISPIADLLPHTGIAVLLDDVVARTETSLSCSVAIGPDSAFYREEGVPVHVGLEYMAQTCAAFRGDQASRAGESPRPGVILGTRRYFAARAWFARGERLVVTAGLVYRDEEVGMFDCVIRSGAEIVATARLIVAEPKDFAGLLGRQGGTNDG